MRNGRVACNVAGHRDRYRGSGIDGGDAFHITIDHDQYQTVLKLGLFLFARGEKMSESLGMRHRLWTLRNGMRGS